MRISPRLVHRRSLAGTSFTLARFGWDFRLIYRTFLTACTLFDPVAGRVSFGFQFRSHCDGHLHMVY